MRAVCLPVTLFVCLLSGHARADEEPDVAFAADQPNITSTTIESEGLQLRALGHMIATKAELAHQAVVIAQAETDFARVSALFKKNATTREEFLLAQFERDRARLGAEILNGKIDQEKWTAELWKLRLVESGSDQDFRLPLAEALLELYQATLRGLQTAEKLAAADLSLHVELALIQTKLEAKHATAASQAEHARLEEQAKAQAHKAVATEIKFMTVAIKELKRTIARLKGEEGNAFKVEEVSPRRIDAERRAR